MKPASAVFFRKSVFLLHKVGLRKRSREAAEFFIVFAFAPNAFFTVKLTVSFPAEINRE